MGLGRAALASPQTAILGHRSTVPLGQARLRRDIRRSAVNTASANRFASVLFGARQSKDPSHDFPIGLSDVDGYDVDVKPGNIPGMRELGEGIFNGTLRKCEKRLLAAGETGTAALNALESAEEAALHLIHLEDGTSEQAAETLRRDAVKKAQDCLKEAR